MYIHMYHTNHPHLHTENLFRFIKHVNVFICYIILMHFKLRKHLKVGAGMVCVVPMHGIGACAKVKVIQTTEARAD